MMKVNEIFTSIEGEGIRAGTLCTFIRLTGCNLRCKWCDTKYSFRKGEKMDIEEILRSVPDDVENVTITGGEPLTQDIGDLIYGLVALGHNVNIETNGSMDFRQLPNPFGKVMITADYKLPSSGMTDRMDTRALSHLTDKDVLKFVAGTDEDLKEIDEVLSFLEPQCHIFISPVFGMIDLKDIVEWMKHSDNVKKYNARLQIQLHKIIWDKDTRGV